MKNESPTHVSWRKMLERCSNPNCAQWPWYGARGIVVCPQWRTSFASFLTDMGTRPTGTTLDRVDGSKNYEPGNCRWATKTEQARNQRSNVRVIYEGRDVLLLDLCEEMGLSWMAVYQRLRAGMTVEQAVAARANTKLAVVQGRPSGASKLTVEQVRAIRARGGKTRQQWADELRVSLGCEGRRMHTSSDRSSMITMAKNLGLIEFDGYVRAQSVKTHAHPVVRWAIK